MNEELNWSQDGYPWTKYKMNKALKLRNNGEISFAFGYEKLSKLNELDEKVLAKRKDLRLHVWSVEDNDKFTDEQLNTLANLKNVENLELGGFKNVNIDQLAQLENLRKITIRASKKTDIQFLQSLKKLEYCCLMGKFENLEVLANCSNLEKLHFEGITINSLQFLSNMHLTSLMIDSCRVNCSFKPLETLNVADLLISSISNLSDISFISKMTQLEKLRIHAKKVENLPDFSNVPLLTSLELNYMKVLQNPEMIKSIVNLEKLRLTEINTKLPAEEFFFVANMNKIHEFDFRFIDFNKRRIQKLNEYFHDFENIDLKKDDVA